MTPGRVFLGVTIVEFLGVSKLKLYDARTLFVWDLKNELDDRLPANLLNGQADKRSVAHRVVSI